MIADTTFTQLVKEEEATKCEQIFFPKKYYIFQAADVVNQLRPLWYRTAYIHLRY